MSSDAPGPQQRRGGRPNSGGRGRSGNSGGNRRNNNGGRNRQHQQRADAPAEPGPTRGNNRSSNSNSNSNAQQAAVADSGSSLRDEDILIAFMPFLKGDNPEASRIHEDFQATRDQASFIKAARALIERHQNPGAAQPSGPTLLPLIQTHAQVQQQQQQRLPPVLAHPASPMQSPQPQQHVPFQKQPQPHSQFQHQQHYASPPSQYQSHLPPPSSANYSSSNSDSMHRVDPSSLFNNQAQLPSFLASAGISDQRAQSPTPDRLATEMRDLELNDDPMAVMQSIWGSSPITPPRPNKPAVSIGPATNNHQSAGPTSPWAAAPTSAYTTDDFIAPTFLTPPRGGGLTEERDNSNQSGQPVGGPTIPMPNLNVPPRNAGGAAHLHSRPAPTEKDTAAPPVANVVATPPVKNSQPKSSSKPATTSSHTHSSPSEQQRKGAKPQPTRLWTHFKEQPGRLVVNGRDGQDTSLVMKFRPRQELFAYWSLPVKFLKEAQPKSKSLDDALKNLAIGLFRRGCAENTTQASIISKFVTERSDYGVDAATQIVRGKLPFFSPRTPGHVVLRLYWHDDPSHTLASGPTLLVQVTEQDFDSSIRFILSNFKAKKTNPTSLSSLLSLAQVLETPLTVPNEAAARAVWGCIQESRKVIEVCNHEYMKTCSKLEELEIAVEKLKTQVELDDDKSLMSVHADASHDGPEDSALASLREKTRLLMTGRASNLRKWRDAQLAFASILKAAVRNPSMSMLLRRDMVSKMRAEYQLWCPLSEEFAIPSDTTTLWYDTLRDLPSNISVEDHNALAKHRTKMQLRTLGFDPNVASLSDILFPAATSNQRSMDAGAVSTLNNMSAAMGKYFRELYDDEETVVRRRELIRERAENVVTASGAFPPGTRVVIFGSSANGFGSPNSDIDMSLILPPGHEFAKDDIAGSAAMEKLATCLSESGMEEVDAARLTARIPIIRFFCPNLLPTSNDDDAKLIECDISMHNPLAVLNTSLLRTYAEITPITRVLAAIIKRWAKRRDINNPARHTLSSYGYILMLLHFLTYHKRNDKGLVEPIAPSEGDYRYRDNPNQQGRPILPNLQWMDPAWPTLPPGTPYRELATLSVSHTPHPFEEGKSVNAYFYRPSTPTDKAKLQSLFPGQDLSLAILLASFFRYYAYQFDYRKCVVSLHSTAARGLVQREVKTEIDCWRNYSAALTIEDPFETFYDVAHVLRGGDYHRIRREFAFAYSKIADAATGRAGSWNKPGLKSMTGEELLDWICEPIESEKLQHE